MDDDIIGCGIPYETGVGKFEENSKQLIQREVREEGITRMGREENPVGGEMVEQGNGIIMICRIHGDENCEE